MSFANIYCWQDSYCSQIAHWHGWLLIRFTIDNHTTYMQPIGSGDIAEVIDALAADAHSLGQPLRLFGLSDKWQQSLESLYPEQFAFHASAANADYIYLSEDLATLPGRKYQPKRNFINRFVSRYSYRFEPISEANLADCIDCNHRWCEEKGIKCNCTEQQAIIRFFDHFHTLPLEGWILYADNAPAAFAIGSAINHDTFCIHIEKTIGGIEGAAAMINNLVAVELRERYKFINREEDLGIEGLRRAKQSYYPVELLQKYAALKLTDAEQQMRQLWQRTFGDSRADVDHFLVRIYNPQLCLTHSQEGSVVAMLHIVPLSDNHSCSAYIYAVATDTAYRNRGFASTLLKQAIERIERSKEYDRIVLIPASDALAAYYAKFGFESNGELLNFSQYGFDYDLGTGNAEQDFAVVRKI